MLSTVEATDLKYSKYQKNIFDWVKNGQGHGAINAVAGSGKTTTGVDAMANIDMFQSVLFTAFNRHIKSELEQRTRHMSNVKVNTYNSLGWGACLRNNKNTQLETSGKTERHLKKELGDYDNKKYQLFRGPINKLVSLFKGTCCFRVKDAEEKYEDLVNHHDIVTPDYKDFESVLFGTYESVIYDQHSMDFDDQIFMPLCYNYPLPKYDFIMVDEFQDTNDMQSELIKGCLRSQKSRMMVFGDPWQAIYGFRGATPAAMETWIKEFHATELPLSICYRCPKNVVREAQKIVKHIEAAPKAKEGVVGHLSMASFMGKVKDRDFVLCRTTAPLISACLDFIRQGRPASVRGREVGDQLTSLVKVVCNGSVDLQSGAIKDFTDRLSEHYRVKYANLVSQEKEQQAQALMDKVDTLLVIEEQCKTVGDLTRKINSLFDDEQRNGIQLMTCHKSKGLQNPNVFVLKPEQLEPNWNSKKQWQQEEQKRLKYVTITRAQENLFYVSE